MSTSLSKTPDKVLNPSKRTSLKTGAILNWISLGINFSAAFVVTPIVIHKLGNAGFGMWALIQSFSGYYGLVNLGLASALQRFVSRDLAKDDIHSLQETVGTAIGFFSCTGVVVLLAAATLAGPAAGFFNIEAADAKLFAFTLLLCSASVVADFFGALTSTLFTAKERFDLSNVLGICRQTIQTSGILLALHLHPSINSLAIVVCSTSLGFWLIGWWIAGRLYPNVRLSWLGGRLARLKELLHYGTSTVLLTVSNIVRLRLGSVVIAKTTSLAAVGTFSVASNLVLNMNTIISSTLNVLNPRFTRLDAKADTAEVKRLYRISTFVAATMACGMGLMIFVFGERFIRFWLGEGFHSTVAILHVLAFAYVIALAQAPSWNLMFALAKHHFMARVTIAEAAAIVILGLWLSHYYGAIGFAWGTAASMLVTKIFIHAPFSAKLADLKLSEYLAPMAFPFLIGFLLWVVTWQMGFGAALQTHGIVFFLGTAAVVGLIYLGLITAFCRRKDYLPAFATKYLR